MAISHDVWKYGAVALNEPQTCQDYSRDAGFKLRDPKDLPWNKKIKLYTGLTTPRFLDFFRKHTTDQLAVVEKLKTTTPNNLIDFRHQLVRMVRIAENLEGYANAHIGTKKQLTQFTDKLPIIIRQIAQLFQAIVLRYYGYDKNIGLLFSERLKLINTVNTMSEQGICVGEIVYGNNDAYRIVAKPEFIEDRALFSGKVVFSAEKNGKSEASITLAKTSGTNGRFDARQTEIAYHGKDPKSNVGVWAVALEVTELTPGENFTISRLQDLALYIFSQEEEPLLVCNAKEWDDKTRITKNDLDSSKINNLEQMIHNLKAGLPKFWTTDMSQFELKSNASGADVKDPVV